jgi:hypothetical protein
MLNQIEKAPISPICSPFQPAASVDPKFTIQTDKMARTQISAIYPEIYCKSAISGLVSG